MADAQNIVRPGYTGILSADSKTVRCTSFSLNTQQEAQFFNHVIGLNDTIPSGSTTKGESIGTRQTQRRIWRPSVISLGGSLSFPATENTTNTFFTKAQDGSYIQDLTYQYYVCPTDYQNGITFRECRINGYDLNVQAGDILNITVDIASKDAESINSNFSHITSEKLITWDKVIVSTKPEIKYIKGFTMKINNNIQHIYTARKSDEQNSYKGLLPYDLRIGMQEVTGSVSCYLEQGQRFIPLDTSKPSTINFSAPGLAFKMDVVFYTSQLEGIVGPIVCEIPYTGVGKTF